jgi:hypothetical protein
MLSTRNYIPLCILHLSWPNSPLYLRVSIAVDGPSAIAHQVLKRLRSGVRSRVTIHMTYELAFIYWNKPKFCRYLQSPGDPDFGLAIVESLFRWRLSVGERWVEWKLCERTNNYLWTALNYLNISPKLQILCTYCSLWCFHLSASLLHVDCRLSFLQIFCDFHIEYLATLTPWTELASAALPA